MRETRRQLPHRQKAGDVHELGLQFLLLDDTLLPFGEIADEAGKTALSICPQLADRQMHRKGRTVLALPGHHPADADDAPLAGALIALHIAVVTAEIRLRHQSVDV